MAPIKRAHTRCAAFVAIGPITTSASVRCAHLTEKSDPSKREVAEPLKLETMTEFRPIVGSPLQDMRVQEEFGRSPIAQHLLRASERRSWRAASWVGCPDGIGYFTPLPLVWGVVPPRELATAADVGYLTSLVGREFERISG